MNQTVLILGIGVIIFIGLLYLNRNLFPEVLVRIIPFFRFFPYMAVLYVGFSILLTTATMSEILIEIGFASLKILLMVSIMALYIEQSLSSGVLLALRSLWSTLNRPWKWVEDFFLFFELTFLFFMNDKERIQNALRLIGELEDVSRKEMHEILGKSDNTTKEDYEELILLEFRGIEKIKEILEK